MRVQVIDRKDNVVEPLAGAGKTAWLAEYTNKITGKPDPEIIFAPGRFAHMSTLTKMGFRIQNIETREIITIPDLSPA